MDVGEPVEGSVELVVVRQAELQLEQFALFVHGSLFSLHVLGIIYNIRRRNKLDVIAHALAAAYDARAVYIHLTQIKELEPQ